MSTNKEEKRKSSKIVNIVNKKKSIINNYQQIPVEPSRKHSVRSRNSHIKLDYKSIKRIGCKQKINAFSYMIEPQKQQTNQIPVQKVRTNNILNEQKALQKHIKRIGKQKFIQAYKTQVSNQNQEISPAQKDQPSITINRVAEDKNDKINNCVSIQIQRTGTGPDESQDDSINILDGCNSNSILFQKSQAENNQDQSNQFSINIKMVDSEDGRSSRMEELSGFGKSDQCIQSSIRTQSDNAVSRSDIIQGSFQKLVNESFTKSLNSSDSKIEQLLEEIQKNYQKNNENYPLNDMNQVSKPKQRDSGNYLTVPINRRISFPKTNISEKKEQQKIKQIFGTSQNNKKQNQIIQTIITIKEISRNQSQIQDCEKVEKSIEQQILETLISQQVIKSKQRQPNKKKTLQKKVSILKKGPKISSGQLKNKQNILKEISNNDIQQKRNFMYHSLQQKSFTPLKLKKENELVSTQGPKRTIYQQQSKSQQNLTQSGVKIYAPQSTSLHVQNFPIIKKTNSIQKKQNGSLSLHSHIQKQNQIKKQSIAARFQNTKKQQLLPSAQMKKSVPMKRNYKDLEVNKYLMEARKMMGEAKLK